VQFEQLTVCIFSFNRGKFLRNCVNSILKCIPGAEIVIFDDNSSDPATCSYLEESKDFCLIVRPETTGQIKHGGLYLNMNTALQMFSDRDLICFLQDDTQIVRPVSNAELRDIGLAFEENPRLGFIHPCFIRGVDLQKRPVTPLSGPTPSFFFRKDTGQSAGIHYSDLVVFEPKRLIDADWSFNQSEPANDRQSKAMFGMMAYMWLPFAMWLPEVPAYRGKKKTLGLRLAEHKKQVGFYPFVLWSRDHTESVRNQASPRLPVAEDLLDCSPATPPKPWTYNPLTGLSLLKSLNNVEVTIRRWLKSVVG
jgi:glycosyltransferase involved in cell wall biosynthesis